VLVTLQVGILGVVFGHDLVDESGALIGVVVIERQQRFESIVCFSSNEDIRFPRLGVDGDRFGRIELLSLLQVSSIMAISFPASYLSLEFSAIS
jgi:hypothetical protein